jgi:hypothetical protein
MKIGLMDIDGRNFPNLALMKLSAYHKSVFNEVEWVNHFNHYDIVYKSKVFTFTQDDGFYIDSNVIIKGGTGYDATVTLPIDIENIRPDYSLYPQYKSAYGFLTRGCPNKCSWCIVPKKEGNIRPHADIEDILCGRTSAILMDNNVLASDWGIKQIEKIIKLKIKVDFNQGLDARLIDHPMAKLLAQVKWLSPLRMSCDTDNMLDSVIRATNHLRDAKCTPSNYFIYVLVKDIESAYKRVIVLDSMKLDPFAQPYIDFSGKNKVTKKQKRFARWVNHKAIFRSVEYKNYK